MGRAMVQITMVFAELERANSSVRITAWHAHRTRAGTMPSAKPYFGYRRERDESGRMVGPLLTDDAAAQIIRGAAEEFLNTSSTSAARRYLHAHGHDRTATEVRRLLLSPTLAGYRLVEGGNRPTNEQRRHGTRIKGDWPAIIDAETHDRIVEILTDERRAKLGRPASQRWLLTSMIFCGRCGRPMGGGGNGRYRCLGKTEPVGDRCCTGIKRDELEPYVVERVLAQITPARWKALRRHRPTTFVDTAAMEAELEQMAGDWGAGLMSRGEFYAARDALLGRINDAEQRNDTEAPELPDVADLHGSWGSLTIDQQRLVVAVVVDNVTVAPGEPGGGSLRWQPEARMASRVTIRWR
jgi:hypothetical protein